MSLPNSLLVRSPISYEEVWTGFGSWQEIWGHSQKISKGRGVRSQHLTKEISGLFGYSVCSVENVYMVYIVNIVKSIWVVRIVNIVRKVEIVGIVENV